MVSDRAAVSAATQNHSEQGHAQTLVERLREAAQVAFPSEDMGLLWGRSDCIEAAATIEALVKALKDALFLVPVGMALGAWGDKARAALSLARNEQQTQTQRKG